MPYCFTVLWIANGHYIKEFESERVATPTAYDMYRHQQQQLGAKQHEGMELKGRYHRR